VEPNPTATTNASGTRPGVCSRSPRAKFMNWNCGRGGGGAIDLVIHLRNLGFAQAVQWLGQSFPDSFQPEPQPAFPKSDSGHTTAQSLPNSGACAVLLLSERASSGSRSRIEPESIRRSLRRDPRANAVFLLLGKETSPSAPNCAAPTQRPWHGLAQVL